MVRIIIKDADEVNKQKVKEEKDNMKVQEDQDDVEIIDLPPQLEDDDGEESVSSYCSTMDVEEEDEHGEEKKQALENLKALENDISLIESKMGHSESNIGREIVLISGNVWYHKTFSKDASFYNGLHTSIQKRKSLGYVEELMKVLLKLDEIVSYGDDIVRDTRRSLVKKINCHLLERADQLCKVYTKIHDLDVKVQESISQRKEEEIESDNEMEQVVEKQEEEEEEEEEEKNMAQLKYKIFEDPEKIFINILARNKPITLKDCQVYVDGNKLGVRVNGFEEELFQLSSNLKSNKTTYKIVGPSILRVTIPKLIPREKLYRQRQYESPSFNHPFGFGRSSFGNPRFSPRVW